MECLGRRNIRGDLAQGVRLRKQVAADARTERFLCRLRWRRASAQFDKWAIREHEVWLKRR